MAGRKGFIFTNRKHSDKAIMGSILGMISLISLVIVIFLSYRQQGETPAGYGITGLLAAIFSMVGSVLGALTVRDKNIYAFFPWMAMILNGLVLVLLGVLLYAGI